MCCWYHYILLFTLFSIHPQVFDKYFELHQTINIPDSDDEEKETTDDPNIEPTEQSDIGPADIVDESLIGNESNPPNAANRITKRSLKSSSRKRIFRKCNEMSATAGATVVAAPLPAIPVASRITKRSLKSPSSSRKPKLSSDKPNLKRNSRKHKKEKNEQVQPPAKKTKQLNDIATIGQAEKEKIMRRRFSVFLTPAEHDTNLAEALAIAMANQQQYTSAKVSRNQRKPKGAGAKAKNRLNVSKIAIIRIQVLFTCDIFFILQVAPVDSPELQNVRVISRSSRSQNTSAPAATTSSHLATRSETRENAQSTSSIRARQMSSTSTGRAHRIMFSKVNMNNEKMKLAIKDIRRPTNRTLFHLTVLFKNLVLFLYSFSAGGRKSTFIVLFRRNCRYFRKHLGERESLNAGNTHFRNNNTFKSFMFSS